MPARQETPLAAGQQLISVSGLISTAGSLRTVQDQPVLHDAQLAANKQFRVEQTLAKAAQAVAGNALAAGLAPIAELRAGLQSANAAVGVRQIELLHEDWQSRLARRTAIGNRLMQRTNRGKWSTAKATLLLVILGLSDTALNASASIAGGDPIWLSVVEFAGVAAAAVGVGWLVGHLLSRLVSAYRAGEVPDDAAELGIESFYRRRGDLSLIAVLCGLLLGITGLLGWAVADLRVEAQMSWIYGLFTAVVSIGAAAVAYVAEDTIGKFMDLQLSELNRVDRRLAELTGQVNAARGLEAQLGTELESLAVHASASAAAIRVQGEFEIQFAHPETYGHLADHDTRTDWLPIDQPAELIELMVRHGQPSSRLPFADQPPSGGEPPAVPTNSTENAERGPAEPTDPDPTEPTSSAEPTAQQSEPGVARRSTFNSTTEGPQLRVETALSSLNGSPSASPSS